MNLSDLNDIFLICEQKNEALYRHMERVSLLCYATGKELELSSKELEIVYISGLLHDIGKFNINIDLHHYSTISSAIVNSLNGFNDVPNVILQIEEQFNGKGYPLGLKESEIKLLSYIVKISDYYDELRINGLTHDESTIQLRSNSNLLFPGQIITPFIKAIVKNDLQHEY
jgi:HD-GYP domain-containing protein (c-di-GMP phosphodiesterase class II)